MRFIVMQLIFNILVVIMFLIITYDIKKQKENQYKINQSYLSMARELFNLIKINDRNR